VKQYPQARYRDCPLFADVTDAQWNDWRWQLAHVSREV
jgi:hypothetical protein